jgi:predicted nucleic acid-binding protein
VIYVFDSSFVGAQIIPDEADPIVAQLYSRISNEDEKYVPNLFWYEITNVFKNLLRRKRYSFDDVLQFFVPLEAIRLTVDHETGPAYARKILRLCNDYTLSAYDAAYLELAGRKKAALCTLDEDLITTAKEYGVTVLEA